jgi:signal transduction histidine kinase
MAVAKDRVRLRSRNMRVLQRVEQAVQTRETWGTAVEHMLAGIAQAYDALVGAVFLTGDEPGSASLTLSACWPNAESALPLAGFAEFALAAENREILETPSDMGHVTVVPLVSEGRPMGVAALASRSAYTMMQLAFLRVAASVMAIVIRNGQLYAELESQAVLEERHRLARDMHDGLAQYLGFLNLKVQQVERLLGREPEAARQALHEVREGINDMYAEVRVAIQDLRSPGVHERDLAEQLQEFVAAFAVRSGLAISFTSNGNPDVSPLAKVHLLRITEEALTNIHRHAQARQCWVRLEVGSNGAMLEIKDDGIGLADGVTPNSPVSFGLRIMQERVQSVGGHFRLHSRPGEGVLLQVTIPTRRQPESVLRG